MTSGYQPCPVIIFEHELCTPQLMPLPSVNMDPTISPFFLLFLTLPPVSSSIFKIAQFQNPSQRFSSHSYKVSSRNILLNHNHAFGPRKGEADACCCGILQ
jgi:hypothetical protein